MLTRDQVIALYHLTVDTLGVVTNPGRFEREPWWVVALWDLAMDGFEDTCAWEGDTPLSCFRIDAELSTAMGSDPATYAGTDRYVVLWQDSQGFVLHAIMTGDEIDALQEGDHE